MNTTSGTVLTLLIGALMWTASLGGRPALAQAPTPVDHPVAVDTYQRSANNFAFNPTNQMWTGYMMPEPYAHDRRTWIDNSTTPVTVWFVDQQGYMVRIQPLD